MGDPFESEDRQIQILNNPQFADSLKEFADNLSMHSLQAILDVLPVSMLISEVQNGLVVYGNQQAARILGCNSSSELKGVNFQKWVAPISLPALRQFINSPQQKNKTHLVFQLTILRQDGASFLAEIENFLLRDETGLPKYIICTLRDITQQRQMEYNLESYRNHLLDMVRQQTQDLALANQQLTREIEQNRLTEIALKNSEERYRSLLEAQSEIIVRFTQGGRLKFANQPFIHYFQPDENFSLYEIHNSLADANQREEFFRIFLKTKPHFHESSVMKVSTPFGLRWIDWNVQLVQTDHPDEIEYQCVGRDITTQKEFDAERESLIRRLQTLSSRLIEIQEAERRSLALELHDEIGQLLNSAKISLDLATQLPGPAVAGQIERARAILSESIQKVREMTLDLRPAQLDDLGLVPALQAHIQRYTSLTGVNVELVHSLPPGSRFSTAIETALYRIVQESLTNVARHAGTNIAKISFWQKDENLHLTIQDEGKGFDVDQIITHATSTGINGMKERAHLLNGEVHIESAQNEGTLIHVILPIKPIIAEGKSG